MNIKFKFNYLPFLLQLISLSLANKEHKKHNHSEYNNNKIFTKSKSDKYLNHTKKTDSVFIDEEIFDKNPSIRIPLIQNQSSANNTFNSKRYSHKTSSICKLLHLPVLENIANGINVRTLDLLPTVLTNRNGFAKTIFNFTCSRETLVTNPLDANEVINQPDQIVEIQLRHNRLTSKLYKNLSDYVEENNKAVGLITNNSSEKVGHFIDSVGYGKLKSRLRESKQFVVETHLVKNGYTIKLNQPEALQNSLSSTFVSDLDRLLPDFTRCWDLYENFLDYWGTHYFSEAEVGQMASMRTTARKDYLNSGLISEETLMAFLAEEFLRKTDQNFNNKVITKRLKSQVANDEQSFSKNIKTKFFWYGGNWKHGEPGLIHGGKLVGLHTLVKDPLLKNALQKAILIRGAQSSLTDLEDTISGGEDVDYEEDVGIISLLEKEKKTLRQLNEYFAVVSDGNESYDDDTLEKNINKLVSLKATIEAKAGL